MRAVCSLNDSQHYGREAFCAGLRALGYQVVDDLPVPMADDILVIWNRYGRRGMQADTFEAAGARVLVVENGYLGKRWHGGDWFAVSIGHHAGPGWTPTGDSSRWDRVGAPLLPWRPDGETVILGQRSIGEAGIASPPQWEEKMQRVYGGRIRVHPGKAGGADLERDLSEAGQVVTWSSGSALLALMWGIPVLYGLNRWVGGSAARHISEGMQAPLLRDDAARLAMFQRLAWAMWTIDEIRTGEALGTILKRG